MAHGTTMLVLERARTTLGDPDGGREQMIELECPWCSLDQQLDLTALRAVDEFRCDDCGTTVEVTDHAQEVLPLAA